MNLIEEYNKKYEFFKDITGEAMKVHRKFHKGLLESAYEAALKYLLEQKGYAVERQVVLPMYWDDVQLDQTYRLDLVVNENIIVEIKAPAPCMKSASTSSIFPSSTAFEMFSSIGMRARTGSP